MYEVELKVRADHDRIRERLADVSEGIIESVEQRDTYYDAPDRDFATTDEALRVRVETRLDGAADEGSTVDGRSEERVRSIVLTYKGPLVDTESKTRKEHETQVRDEETIRAILSGLGYDPAATVHKERERYAVEDCLVTLDTVDGIGEFVEVEVEAEEDIGAARERASAVLDRLGLNIDDQIRTSYLGLCLAERE